jgi:hypothetical protein
MQSSKLSQPAKISDARLLELFKNIGNGKTLSKKEKEKKKNNTIANDKNRKWNKSEIIDGMEKASQLTKRDRGHDVVLGEGSISQRTFEKYKKKKIDNFKLRSGVGQTLTIAHEKAMSCPRTYVQWAMLYSAFAHNLPPICKSNVDATGILVWRHRGINQFELICSKADMEKPLESSRYQGKLPIFVKQMFHGSAGGDIGKMVLIVQIKGLKEGDWYHEDLVGLTRESDSTLKGGLYCASTRCMKGTTKPGSQNAWNHWMMNYMIPFCKNITDVHKPCDVDDTPLGHIITMDNEEVIIRETKDPDIIAALDEAKIDLLRCPPSTTPDNNFLDKGTVFKSLKAGVKTAIQTLKDTNSEILEKNLKAYFVSMKIKFPHAELTSECIEKIIHAIMVVVWVNKNGGYVTPDKVV